jgi:hypothetical protein
VCLAKTINLGGNMIRKGIALLCLIAALAACEPRGGDKVGPTPNVPQAASQGASGGTGAIDNDNRKVIGFKGDCAELEAQFLKDESTETEPCVTKENGLWRLITSWEREESITLSECKEEDGSGDSAFPCIWIARHPDKAEFKYVVFLDEAK